MKGVGEKEADLQEAGPPRAPPFSVRRPCKAEVKLLNKVSS